MMSVLDYLIIGLPMVLLLILCVVLGNELWHQLHMLNDDYFVCQILEQLEHKEQV